MKEGSAVQQLFVLIYLCGVFDQFPESLRPAFPRLKEKLEDSDPGEYITVGAGVGLVDTCWWVGWGGIGGWMDGCSYTALLGNYIINKVKVQK